MENLPIVKVEKKMKEKINYIAAAAIATNAMSPAMGIRAKTSVVMHVGLGVVSTSFTIAILMFKDNNIIPTARAAAPTHVKATYAGRFIHA